MNEALFFSDKIQEINKELGISIASGFLEESQAYLASLAQSDYLDIDVITAENASYQIKKIVKDWVSLPSSIRAHIITPSIFKSKSIHSAFSAIALCCLDDEMYDDPSIPLFIAAYHEQYKIVLIVNSLTSPEALIQFSGALGSGIKTKIINIDQIINKSLTGIIEEALPASSLPVVKSFGRLNSVKPTLALIQQILQTENKIIQTRKLLGVQNQLVTRKDEQALNNMELANTIRQAIQKFSSELDKNFRVKYEELNKPVTGYFSKHIQELSERLTDFKRESIAEKDEREEVKLTDQYQFMFIDSMKKTISEELKKDVDFLSLSINELTNRINTLLSTRSIEPIKVENDVIEFPDIKKSIAPYCQFNRQYKSELIKKGMMEYFVALRDYTGIIMVSTGLLAPLTIVANISENGFLKHLSNGIKFAMAGIAIFLIIYGVYDLRTRIPKKRAEEFLKELEKGKEFVISEGKRMGNEVSRDWTAAIGNWMREISQAVSFAFEKKIKDTQQAKANLLNQEKIQQQRRQQNQDAHQKNIVNAERIKDSMAARFKEMYADAEKKLTL